MKQNNLASLKCVNPDIIVALLAVDTLISVCTDADCNHAQKLELKKGKLIKRRSHCAQLWTMDCGRNIYYSRNYDMLLILI